MKRNIYLAAALLVTSSVGISYLSANNYDTYSPRTEEERTQNIYLTSKERSIKGALEYYNMIRQDVNTGNIPADARRKAFAQVEQMAGSKLKKTLPFTWIERGPDNVGGRTRSILVDRNNNNIMYCGGVSGGLFRSTNRAQTWSPVDDHMDNMIITSITQTPDGYIYIGTGEEPFLTYQTGEMNSGFVGTGMFRSADGLTFEYLTSTDDPFVWRNTTALASDNVTNRIYAGNNGGIYWSEDKGNNWTKVSGVSAGGNGCRQILVNKEGTVFAHAGSKLYRSTDGKTNYTDITPPNASTSRFEMAITPEDVNYIYAVGAGNDDRMAGLWRSKDKGDNWERLLEKGNEFFDPLAQLGTTAGQGRYDLALAVAAFDKNRVFIGGVQLGMWSETDAESIIATTFNQDPRNRLYLHADKHEFVWDYSVDPPVMWIGSDGGLAVTDFKVSSITGFPTYAHMSKGLNIFQSYGCAANEQGHVVSGSQDNGNQLMNFKGNSKNAAVEVFGGDGFQNEYSRINPNVVFVEAQYGSIGRSQNSGESTSTVIDGRANASGGSFPFNTQFRIFEDLTGDSSTLFAVGKTGSIFISPNVLDFSVSPIFFKVEEHPDVNGTNYISEMEFSSDGDKLYFGTAGGQLYRLSNLRNATYDSSIVGGNDIVPDVVKEQLNVSSGLPSGRSVLGIGIDPLDPDYLVVVYGNYNSGTHVYLSTNASTATPTFTSIDGNLPDMPVYDVQVVYTGETSPKRVIVLGTEFGVFASDNGGASWSEENEGMARVPVFKVRAYQFKPWEGYRLFLGTHGRGTFESKSLMTGIKPTTKVETEKLTVYPNPATNSTNIKFTLEGNNADVAISVVNVQGKIVVSNIHANQTSGEHTYKVNTASLPAGTYFVRVETATQKGYSKLIVVR